MKNYSKEDYSTFVEKFYKIFYRILKSPNMRKYKGINLVQRPTEKDVKIGSFDYFVILKIARFYEYMYFKSSYVYVYNY